MGEFAPLFYVLCALFFISFVLILGFTKRWIRLRGWRFTVVLLLTVLILLHPALLGFAYWYLLLDTQVIQPYPYTVQDRISMALFWIAVLSCIGGLCDVCRQRYIMRKKGDGK